MSGTVSSNAPRRKVRCPKCTVCLTEPPIPIYQCPICSTLLLAKRSASEFKEELPSGNGGDAKNIQRTADGGRSIIENGPVSSEPINGVESVSSIPGESFKQGNALFVDDPDKEQEAQRTASIVEEISSSNEGDGSEQDNCVVPNNFSKKQAVQGIGHADEERTAFEVDSGSPQNTLVGVNARELVGELGGEISPENPVHVGRVQQIRERWFKLEKDALIDETRKSPQHRGRQSTLDRLAGRAFGSNKAENCYASQDVESGGAGKDAGRGQVMLDQRRKDSEQPTLEGLSEQDNESVRFDSSQKQVQHGVEDVGDERASLETQRGPEQEEADAIRNLGENQKLPGTDGIDIELDSSQGDNGVLLHCAADGNLDDSHATCSENLLLENGLIGEKIEQIPGHWPKLEKGALIGEPGKTQNLYAMECVEKGYVKPERSPSCELNIAVTDNHGASRQLGNGHKEGDAESYGMLESNGYSDGEGQDLGSDLIDSSETTRQPAELFQHLQEGASNYEEAIAGNGSRKIQGQLAAQDVEGESKQSTVSLLGDSNKEHDVQEINHMEKDVVTCELRREQSLGLRAAADGILGQVLKFEETDSCEASHQSMSSRSRKDVESIPTLEGRSKHDKHSEMIQEISGEGSQKENVAINNFQGKKGQPALLEEEISKQEDASAIDESSKEFVQQGIDCIKKEGRHFEVGNKLLHVFHPDEANSSSLHDTLTPILPYGHLDREMSERGFELERDAAMNEPCKREEWRGISCMDKENTSPNDVKDCEFTRLMDDVHEGRDAESIQQAQEGVYKPDKKAEILEQTVEGDCKQDNSTAIKEFDVTESQHENSDMHREHEPSDGEKMPPQVLTSDNQWTRNPEHENWIGSECIEPAPRDLEIVRDSVKIAQLQKMKHMEEQMRVSDRIGEQGFDHDGDKVTFQEANGHTNGDFSKGSLHDDDTGKEASFMIRESESDCGLTENVEAETANVCGSFKVPEEKTSSIYDSLHNAFGGPVVACGSESAWDVSKPSLQWQHSGGGMNIALVDEGGEGDRPSLGHSMDIPRDNNLEASLRYDDVWSAKVGNTERLDMSLCDWQSSVAHNPSEGLKKHIKDAGLADERKVLNSNMAIVSGCEDTVYAPLQKENKMLKQGLMLDEDMPIIQIEALSELNNIDSSSAVPGTERIDHVERPAIPIRTAAMQNFLQRTKKEVTDQQMQLYYKESEAKIYNAPYIEEYKTHTVRSTAGKGNRLGKGSLAFRDHRDLSDGLLSCTSNLQETDRMLDSDIKSVKMNAANELTLREDGQSRKALTWNGSRENVEGGITRSYQPSDCKMAPSERPQMDYYIAKHCENSQLQSLGRSVKVTPVNEARLMNAVPVEPVDCMHADQQEQNDFAGNQKYLTYDGVMDKHPGYLLQGAADSMHSYSVKGSQGSSPRFSPAEKYIHPLGLSPLSAASRSYSLQPPPQTLMSPATLQGHGFRHPAHHSVSPFCTHCIHQAHVQQPQLLHGTMQHHCAARFPQLASMPHQHATCDGWESCQARHIVVSGHDTSDRLWQMGSFSPKSQSVNSSDMQNELHPFLSRRRRHFPPLPRDGAAPYVLCQECDQLLKVPQYLPPSSGSTQKLRCGACGKVSKFSIHQQTNNQTLFGNFKSSRTPWLVRSSTDSKVYPETVAANPYGHTLLLSTNDRGGQLLGPKTAKSVESPHREALGGRSVIGSSLRSHHKRFDNQILHQTTSSARITSLPQSSDRMYYPRSIADIMQAQEFSRSRSRDGQDDNRILNNAGTNGRSYLSSLPPSVNGSSLLGNVSDLCRDGNQKDRIASGGRIMSNGIYFNSSSSDQDGQAFESSNFPNASFWKGFDKNTLNNSAAAMHDSHQSHHTENVGNEALGRNLLTEASPQWQAMGPGHSRSSSKGGSVQVRKWSTPPDSPLIDHFDGESLDGGPSMRQRVSGSSIRSAPWSPGSASPSYDHSAYDATSDLDEMSYQKEHDFSSKFHGPIPQDTNRRPKYFAGLFKKSFKETGKGGQGLNSNRKVMVNGKLLSDVVVKKAEEKAGILSAGSYWYDYQAGFWGILGGPCLGIIPPFIEELNIPLVKDCAGGRTGILVNGRELHHKDLQLLVGRGLPSTPGKAYIMDILGNVVDSASGQRLESLGKLAPTLEKKKCGNGMWQPSDVQSG